MIDVSGLSKETRAFLKANPDFLRSLEADIPKQVAGMNKRREKLSRGKAKWQRDLEDVDRRVEETKRKAEKLREKYRVELDEHLREINQKFLGRIEGAVGELVCPECDEGDKGNKMNGQAWCMKCNCALVKKNELQKWLKLPCQ